MNQYTLKKTLVDDEGQVILERGEVLHEDECGDLPVRDVFYSYTLHDWVYILEGEMSEYFVECDYSEQIGMSIAIIKANPTDILAYQKVIGVAEFQAKPSVGELVDFEGQFLEVKQVVSRQASSRVSGWPEAADCPVWVIV